MKGSQIDQSSWSHDIWKLEKNSGTFQRCRVLTSLFDGARLRRGSTWSTVMDPKASLRFLRLLKLLIATGVISSRQRSILWRTSISSLSPSASKVTKKRVLKKKPRKIIKKNNWKWLQRICVNGGNVETEVNIYSFLNEKKNNNRHLMRVSKTDDKFGYK